MVIDFKDIFKGRTFKISNEMCGDRFVSFVNIPKSNYLGKVLCD
jgi:hypothetical protein